MQELQWDGITRSKTLTAVAVRERCLLLDKAKNGDWSGLLAMLTQNHALVNVTRPDGKALYAAIHHAAYGGAPEEVVQTLVRLGAFRGLRDAQGNRPADIARNRSHVELIPLLEPLHAHHIEPRVLFAIQRHFHEVIRGRVDQIVQEHRLRLPQLEILLEFDSAKCWFAVPEMCGGFACWFSQYAPEAELVVESWCRVCEGSGQRHAITEDGARLIEEGFV